MDDMNLDSGLDMGDGDDMFADLFPDDTDSDGSDSDSGYVYSGEDTNSNNISQDIQNSGEVDLYSSEETEADKKMKMKTALFAVGTGIVIIVAVFIIGAKLKGHKKSALDNINTIQSQQGAQSQQGTQQIQQETQPQQGTQQNNSQSNDNSNNGGYVNQIREGTWVQFDGNADLKLSEEISSEFTVTNVTQYAMIVDAGADKQVKTLLTGSISGLVGTYQLEVPFSKGTNLKAGSVFTIKYKLAQCDGYSVVSDISY